MEKLLSHRSAFSGSSPPPKSRGVPSLVAVKVATTLALLSVVLLVLLLGTCDLLAHFSACRFVLLLQALVCWLQVAVALVGRLAGWLAGWPVDWLVGWWASRPVVVGERIGWRADWLEGWLASWMPGQLVS